MFKENEIIVYKKDVCKIKEIKKNHFNGKDYYVLIPIYDPSLKIDVPIQNSDLIRSLISKEEIDEIIKKIPQIEVIESKERMIENEYKTLLQSGSYDDLIKIIKTTYTRNKIREDQNKKISEKDSYYFNLAEKYLYTEFSIVLNMSYDEAKNYIINEVQKQV